MAGSGTLDKALLDFLALECPPLLPIARQSLERNSSPSQIERTLFSEIEKWTTLPANEHKSTMYPGTTASGAAACYQEYLEELIGGFFRRWEIRQSISEAEKLQMYRWMVLTRTLDNRLKELFDAKDVAWSGYASPMKGFRSFGQEAIAGIALRLRRGEDVIAPVIRDLAVMLALTDDIDNALMAQAGKAETPMGGRDLHIGDLEKGVLPPTAPLAIAAQTLIGIAYAMKMDGLDRVCIAFIGEGGSSLGEWHEALNFAAVQKLNVIFVLENNHWALGTHVSEQSAVARFALKGVGYGIPGITLFGNDPEEIAAASAWAAGRARIGKGPTLLELVTYRRCGHAHHDDSRYQGMQLRKGYELDDESRSWAVADPIALYRTKLEAEGILGDAYKIEHEAQSRVDEATERMRSAAWPKPDEMTEVYAERIEKPIKSGKEKFSTRSAGYDEAIRMALAELMEADENVFVLGEDVGGRYEGAFGVTRGLAKQFGALRCLNTPLAESAIVGCAVGAALSGKRPVVEMQFADFVASGFNALVNNAAKIYWRYRKPVPLVVRLPYGGASKASQVLLGGGPFHSQCPEAWFVRTPGWKIVAPAFPSDAKGLMTAAVRDPNPVIYLEAKGLYSFFSRDLRQDVPIGNDYEIPIGEAAVRREGSDVTCITYGTMVFAALDAAAGLQGQDISMEVIDLRTLVPLDTETILKSVSKTHRVIIAHEDSKRGGFGAEIAAIIAEQALWNLESPVIRVAAPDTPVPYSPPLEYAFLPRAEHIVAAALRILEP